MLRFHLPLTEIKVESEKERKEYIAALKLADAGDLKPLEKLIKQALKQ